MASGPEAGVPFTSKRNGSAAVRGVKQVGGVVACPGHINRNVEPLSGLRPSDIEQVRRRLDGLEGIVVDLRVEAKFGEGGIDALVHAELVKVGSVGRIQRAAAVVFGVRVVIGDAFAAKVVIGAEDLAGNLLRAAVVERRSREFPCIGLGCSWFALKEG